MKFSVLTDFKDASGAYESGNSHDTEKCGLAADRLSVLWEQGLVSLEGKENQPLATKPRLVKPDDLMVPAG